MADNDNSNKVTVDLEFHSETKNMVRFNEPEVEGKKPVARTVYLDKSIAKNWKKLRATFENVS